MADTVKRVLIPGKKDPGYYWRIIAPPQLEIDKGRLDHGQINGSSGGSAPASPPSARASLGHRLISVLAPVCSAEWRGGNGSGPDFTPLPVDPVVVGRRAGLPGSREGKDRALRPAGRNWRARATVPRRSVRLRRWREIR